MRRSAAAVPRPAVRRAAYCLAVRRCAARPPAEEECTDAPTRPAFCPVVTNLGERRAARGSARCRGRPRGAKKSLFAPGVRWLVSTDPSLLPGAANAASRKPGRRRSCVSSRLVIHDFMRICTILAGTRCLCMVALLRVAVVLAASLPEAVKGRCF